jgi:voltage-gated potassium channel
MQTKKITQFREFRMKRKYEILLFSFLVLIFGDVFFPSEFDPTPFLIFQNVLASAILFYGMKKWRIPILLLLVVLVLLELISQLTGFSDRRILFSFYIIYFIFLAAKVYRQILTTKEVNIGMIAAVLCGFIILGLIGGSVFSIIEILHHDSFNNLTQGVGGFGDLIYFSFITIISVGYGDITPATEIAKKAAMFFGLIGHFYSIVVIGIILGKYLSKKD